MDASPDPNVRIRAHLNMDAARRSMSEYDRPLLVTILAVLYALSAIILVLGGIAVLVGGGIIIEGPTDMPLLAEYGAIAFFIVALIELVLCYGFLKGWSIFWYLGVIITVLSILISIPALLVSIAMVVPLIVYVIILLYLFKSNVKLFFLGHE